MTTVNLYGCGSDKNYSSADSGTDGRTQDGGVGGTDGMTPDGGADSGTAALLAPPAAGKGIQITVNSTIAPGQDIEKCMFVRAPAEGLNIVREELRFTAGSHHVLVYMTPYTQIPTKTERGEAKDTSGVFDCDRDGATGDWQVSGVVAGSQSASGPPIVDGLPAGVALKVPGDSVLLVNTHYLNASPQPLNTTAYINLYTIPAADVQTEAGILFLYNRFIRVPGGSAAAPGTGVAEMRCPVSQDITLVSATSHMHRRAVDFTGVTVNPMTGVVDPLFATKSWEDVPIKNIQPGKAIAKGTVLDWACSYANKENRTVVQGFTTADEMCMLIGLYYPRNVKTEVCSLTDTFTGRFMGGQWVGHGTKNGQETADCMLAADTPATGTIFPADQGDSFSKCVVESCPKIAKAMSDAARCLYTQGFSQCASPCAAPKSATCNGCLQMVCSSPMLPGAPSTGYLAALKTAACQ